MSQCLVRGEGGAVEETVGQNLSSAAASSGGQSCMTLGKAVSFLHLSLLICTVAAGSLPQMTLQGLCSSDGMGPSVLVGGAPSGMREGKRSQGLGGFQHTSPTLPSSRWSWRAKLPIRSPHYQWCYWVGATHRL